ncbi:MAG TPA: hypothetical protein VGM56_17905 [Byssovorax sp.]
MRAVAAFALLVAAAACGPSAPRALVLVDGAPDAAHAAIAAKVDGFAKRGRAVTIMKVDAASAVALAARGEAEVAVVPEATPLGDFVSSGRGRDAGSIDAGGAKLRVLEVDGKLHPTVDGPAAHELAGALTAR